MFIELFESSPSQWQVSTSIGFNGRPEFDDLVLEFVVSVLALWLTAIPAHTRVHGMKGLVPLVGFLVRCSGGLGGLGVIESVKKSNEKL